MEPQKPIQLSVRAIVLITLTGVTLAAITTVGLLATVFRPRPPEQPIAFSHRIHAGEKQIDCQYCHTAARRSTSAGLPSVERCMGCHQFLATKQPEIRKLADYWEKKQPIPWVRIHRVPDFVYFSHKRHVAAGVDCETCHGDVKKMDAIYQFSSLEMGWCLSCHQQPRSSDVNLITGAPVGMAEGAEGHSRASLDCATCHK